ncbi:MAG: alpha/beta hydrolase [Ferruginibacter sp.]
MKTAYFNYLSSKIFYRASGSGKPVVLIHGFGEDGDIWQQQVPVLEKTYTLLIPDLPGSGKSEMIPDMSIEGMADCVKELYVNECGGAQLPASFLGHSMGGYITLAIAEKYPQLVKAAGLIHSSAYADSEEKKAARRKSIEFIREHGAYDFLRTAIPGLFRDPEQNADCDALVEAGHHFTAEALVAYYTAMINRPDRTAVLKSLTQPFLFIMGQYDKAVPFEHSLQQSSMPQQSHIHILRKSAHMGMLEETDATNKAMEAFLATAM